MGKNTSKNKGKCGEREVCKTLSETFHQPFERSFSSGSFFGGKNVGRLIKATQDKIAMERGDIIVPRNMSRLIIESKFYKDFPFNLLITNKSSSLLDSWIKQVEVDVDASPDEPFYFVVFKINHKSTYIVVNTKFMSKLKVSGNFSMYKHGDSNTTYLITEFEPFLKENVEAIKELTKPTTLSVVSY